MGNSPSAEPVNKTAHRSGCTLTAGLTTTYWRYEMASNKNTAKTKPAPSTAPTPNTEQLLSKLDEVGAA